MKYLIKNLKWQINKDYNLEKLLYLLIDRPTEYSARYDSCKVWRNEKWQEHREYNLPADIWEVDVFVCSWWAHGKLQYDLY